MSGSGELTTIVIADGHALVRDGLKEMLDSVDDLVVVGEASDSQTTVELVAEKQPHVVLLEVDIPGAPPTATVHQIRVRSPQSAVVILSAREGRQLLQGLLSAGIRAYLLKSATKKELVFVVRTVRSDRGRIYLSVSRKSLLEGQAEPEAVLSVREREVLQFVAQALSNTQIASRMSLSEGTVKRHLHNIFAKLGAVSRIDAVNKALAASLIMPPQRDAPASFETKPG